MFFKLTFLVSHFWGRRLYLLHRFDEIVHLPLVWNERGFKGWDDLVIEMKYFQDTYDSCLQNI